MKMKDTFWFHNGKFNYVVIFSWTAKKKFNGLSICFKVKYKIIQNIK